MADHTLDAKGLNCPLPILKARKALKEVPAGGTLEILATDPGAVADFQAFCRQTGNELVEHSEDGSIYRFVIKHTAA
ncbi:MAG: sulfurtransferase TusA family protein [Woeseiaceae bacterium]|jgi:tRNA 2-thiouridine synthesizing protein A|nr:sulfurtransferase TusA family protein [Woeseiaceae bacterium]